MKHIETLNNCPVCHSNKFSYFEAGRRHLNIDNRMHVCRCRNCRLLFLNPRPAPDARRLLYKGTEVSGLKEYSYKPAGYGAVTESRRALFGTRVKEITANYFSNTPGRVLDIGASSGVFLEEAMASGWEACGVEPSREGTDMLLAKGLQAKQAFAEQLPYPDGYFDWVHANHVFEHLADPLSAAREAYRVLKPGGLAFIEVPNQFDNIQFFRYRLMGKIPVRERNIRSIHHLFFFSKKTLHRLLATSGFSNIRIKDYYGSMRPGIAALGSMLVRMAGRFYLGGPFIQAIARK